MSLSIAERSESLRAPSPLPRAEVFCGLAPTTSKLRHLPPSTPVYAVNVTSPGSSVTASPAVSPASSASCADAFPGGLPRVSRPASVQTCLMSTADDPDDVEDVPFDEQNMNEEEDMTQVAEIDTEISAEQSDGPQRAAYDEFSEDDFTDRFDSFVPVAFDRDAALDDYLVYSRRYGSKPALPPELRDEFPRKRNVGEALWERLYSDISGTFAPRSRTRGSIPLDSTPFRKMMSTTARGRDRPRSAAPNSVRASSGAAERRQRAMAPRAASAHELPNRTNLRDTESRRYEPAHSLAKDDFIDFQNLPARASASARRRWVKRWRGMLRSFGGRRR